MNCLNEKFQKQADSRMVAIRKFEQFYSRYIVHLEFTAEDHQTIRNLVDNIYRLNMSLSEDLSGQYYQKELVQEFTQKSHELMKFLSENKPKIVDEQNSKPSQSSSSSSSASSPPFPQNKISNNGDNCDDKNYEDLKKLFERLTAYEKLCPICNHLGFSRRHPVINCKNWAKILKQNVRNYDYTQRNFNSNANYDYTQRNFNSNPIGNHLSSGKKPYSLRPNFCQNTEDDDDDDLIPTNKIVNYRKPEQENTAYNSPQFNRPKKYCSILVELVDHDKLKTYQNILAWITDDYDGCCIEHEKFKSLGLSYLPSHKLHPKYKRLGFAGLIISVGWFAEVLQFNVIEYNRSTETQMPEMVIPMESLEKFAMNQTDLLKRAQFIGNIIDSNELNDRPVKKSTKNSAPKPKSRLTLKTIAIEVELFTNGNQDSDDESSKTENDKSMILKKLIEMKLLIKELNGSCGSKDESQVLVKYFEENYLINHNMKKHVLNCSDLDSIDRLVNGQRYKDVLVLQIYGAKDFTKSNLQNKSLLVKFNPSDFYIIIDLSQYVDNVDKLEAECRKILNKFLLNSS